MNEQQRQCVNYECLSHVLLIFQSVCIWLKLCAKSVSINNPLTNEVFLMYGSQTTELCSSHALRMFAANGKQYWPFILYCFHVFFCQ